MPRPVGVKYFSHLEASGRGLAAIGHVRALVNAGVPVHWLRPAPGPSRNTPAAEAALIRALAEDAALADLPALLEHTSRALPADMVIAHCAPEMWPELFEAHTRNIGCTSWETDRPPAHWMPLLNAATEIIVPCTINRADFVRAGVRRPVHVVPHGRQHGVNEFAPEELADLRRNLGIAEGSFVFATIGAWTPRNAIPELVTAYLHAFEKSDPVSLVIRTNPAGDGPPPLYPLRGAQALAADVLAGAEAQLGRPLAHVALDVVDNGSGRAVAQLQAIADCYVSFAHGTGWGAAIFAAADRGTPVLVTGWGGHMDYLGRDYPGALPCRMTSAPVWPPAAPSYHGSQRWATVDAAAGAAAMREMVRNPAPARAASLALQRQLVNRYAEPVITQHLLRALTGEG